MTKLKPINIPFPLTVDLTNAFKRIWNIAGGECQKKNAMNGSTKISSVLTRSSSHFTTAFLLIIPIQFTLNIL